MMDTQLKTLILKDLDLNRKFLPAVFAAGLLSMAVATLSDFAFFVGSLLFITTLVAFGIMIVMYGVAQERDKKMHLFVMSLPITYTQYTIAKIISMLICFAVPWAFLFVILVAAILGFESVHNGALPYVTLVMLYFLCNFCLFLSVVMISSSEKIMVSAILVTNVCITIALQALARVPSISQTLETDQIVWSTTVLLLVLAEFILCLLCLSAAVYSQQQKTDLV